MAAVLTALVPLVKEMSKRVREETNEEFQFLLGVFDEIKKLEDNLENLEAFLVDAEMRCITDKSVQGWVRKLKDAMYYAADTLELCQLEKKEWQESRAGRLEERSLGCCQPLLICLRNPIFDLLTCRNLEKLQDFCASFFFCLRDPVFAHDIGTRIMKLNEQLDGIRQGVRDFTFNINLSSYQALDSWPGIDANHTMASMTDELAIAGKKIKADTSKLVQELTAHDKRHIKVVSIVGPGGIGKSTLAQCIYNHRTTKEEFKTRIWLSVTKDFNDMKLLRNAIIHAGGKHRAQAGKDKSLLMHTLSDILSMSKFLLVMDDMWSIEAWNVLSNPVVNACRTQPGSSVLMTTRYQNLAPQMRASFHQHRVTKLHNQDAWSLLKKQLSPNQVARADHYLKKIGMNIIKKCDGLPLAIKVMGGLLSTKSPIESEWTAVLDNPAWSVGGLPEELDNRLYLSYEDLSPQLKQCFLYYSLLRNDRSIKPNQVTHMWISEGFVQSQEGSSLELEEIATKYHRELIMRNLIEPSEKYRNEYTMHDVVRSFAQYMAREELLVLQNEITGVGRNEFNNSHVRRMSVAPSIPLVEWHVLKKKRLLRTLIVDCRINIKHGDSLNSFSSLRVLHITGPNFGGLVESLCQLKHLRYLYLENTDISRLPDEISKMKFLHYIKILNCKKLVNLPSSIIKLVLLRALWLDGSNITVIPRRFAELKDLRELLGFPIHMDADGGWCSLQEIESLSKLRKLRLERLDHVSDSSFAEKAMINSKAHLSYLHLSCTNRFVEPGAEVDQQRQQVIEEVFNNLSPPPSLETLVMDTYYGRRLPNWMTAPTSIAFRNLQHMHLNSLTSCTDLPDGLCQLPSLELLVISNARAIKRVGPEFQAFSSSLTGCGYAAAAPPFPTLKQLRLEGLCEWEEWDWNCDGTALAMPNLENLCIKDCGKLSRLPPGLANSNRISLRKLNLYNLTSLTSVYNFPSVVQFNIFDCPKIKEISGFSRLQEINIIRCQNLKVLEDVPILDSIELEDLTMKTLPEYLRGVKPRYLKVTCSRQLYNILGTSSEFNKMRHIKIRSSYTLSMLNT